MLPAPLFAWSPIPLEYLPVHEWQCRVRTGALHVDELLYDPVRMNWVRAGDHPALRPCFPPPPINWGGVLTFGAIALAVAHVVSTIGNAGLHGLAWDDLRRAVLRRDSYTCSYCGHRGTALTLEVDHVLPVSRGGSNAPENLVAACWECNVEKGSRTGFEYRCWRFLTGRWGRAGLAGRVRRLG